MTATKKRQHGSSRWLTYNNDKKTHVRLDSDIELHTYDRKHPRHSVPMEDDGLKYVNRAYDSDEDDIGCEYLDR